MSIEQNTKILASDVTTSLSGKAPTSHASTKTTYGIGTGSNYGHVKLSDSTSSTSAASAGIAASPKAVKAAYDLANGKQDKLGYTPVKSVNGVSADANGNVNASAQPAPNYSGAVGISSFPYTAPANGIVSAWGNTHNFSTITLTIAGVTVGTVSSNSAANLQLSGPVAKGQTVSISGSVSGAVFIPWK